MAESDLALGTGEVSSPRPGLAKAVLLAVGAFSIMVACELYVSGGGALRGAGLVASYASGMTMIALPCTLPMVLVVVPMAMGSRPRRGIATAVAFGAGATLTLTAYGAAVAVLGQSLGVTGATRLMWLVGGIAAWLLGSSQLGLIPLRLPSWGVRTKRLGRMQAGPAKAFAIGVLLGNAGLGCPCPPWYLLLTGVATSASPTYGAAVGLAQGLGRMTPVVAVAVAAVLGIDGTAALMRRRGTIERWTGGTLVVLGAGIIVFFGLAHSWWEATPIHAGWNHFLAYLGGPQISEVVAGGGPFPKGYSWAPWLFAAMSLGPLAGVKLVGLLRRRPAGSGVLPALAATPGETKAEVRA